ncbi:sporulation protein [Nonomuraea rubra]|uniref:sporulation protein n=1 Tax=Nonomuraea rubra TaxID=46180 RepID=UPI0036225820
MVFKRMLGAFGVGAPSVDTVLSTPRTRPGGTLEEVRLKGGDFDAEIEHVTLGLVARVEIEHGDGESGGLSEFGSTRVSGPFTLRKGEERTIGFRIPVPWEAPISEIAGQPLRGMAVGVRTELAIAKAVDKGDLDMVSVEPLPSQLRILESFLQLGFAFKSADLEAGYLRGVRQELPFYQEIEFYPTGQYAGRVGEVEVTFVADPAGLEVVLEADKRTGRYSSGDAIGRFQVSHEDALRTDWAGSWGGGSTASPGTAPRTAATTTVTTATTGTTTSTTGITAEPGWAWSSPPARPVWWAASWPVKWSRRSWRSSSRATRAATGNTHPDPAPRPRPARGRARPQRRPTPAPHAAASARPCTSARSRAPVRPCAAHLRRHAPAPRPCAAHTGAKPPAVGRAARRTGRRRARRAAPAAAGRSRSSRRARLQPAKIGSGGAWQPHSERRTPFVPFRPELDVKACRNPAISR